MLESVLHPQLKAPPSSSLATAKMARSRSSLPAIASISRAWAATADRWPIRPAIIRAIGDSRTPLVFLSIACALNVAFVIVTVGPLQWGVAGAAASTVIAQALSVIWCLDYVRRRAPALHVHRADWRLRRAEVLNHLRLGLPMGFQASIIAIGTLVVQVALNTLGSDAVVCETASEGQDGKR